MQRHDTKRRQVLGALAGSGRLGGPGRLTAEAAMTAAPSCIPPETTALELVRLFHEKQFRHLLVSEDGMHVAGVISDRDVIRCLGPERRPDREALGRITAADVMSTDLVTIEPGALLDRAATLMLDYGISCLPVVADGVLVGILTNTDLHVVLQILVQTLRESSPEDSVAATA
jgi:acetoin utilization protein AcuB